MVVWLVTVPATPPNITVTPLWNDVPVIVTLVPPVEGPLDGETAEIVGVETGTVGVT